MESVPSRQMVIETQKDSTRRMEQEPWPVLVVGAGAAGLLAALRASELGVRVLLLEKQPKVGSKILISGGTRCNLTQATDSRGIIQAFRKEGRFLHRALSRLSPSDVVDLIEAEGVPTKVEPSGKIFPQSDRALDVQQALIRRLSRSGCTVRNRSPVLELQPGFRVRTPEEVFFAKCVILTTGGASYPGSGTTGDAYAWLEQLGHRVNPPKPALVPICLEGSWILELSGITLPDVRLSVVSLASTLPLETFRGSVVCTHFGISGPAALNVSRAITTFPKPDSLQLECDWLPSLSREELDAEIHSIRGSTPKESLAGITRRWLPARFVEKLLAEHGNIRLAELTNAQKSKWFQLLKATSIRIRGTLGFEKAEVTTGGVALEEVDPKTMESRLVKGLFVAGELLDLDGPIGGYNFQAAFSTGWLAGESAVASLER